MSPADENHPEMRPRPQLPETPCRICGAIVSVLLSTGEAVVHRPPLGGPMCPNTERYPDIVREWRVLDAIMRGK
ncbi:MAG: hypothetical protein PHS14_21260 [Elusimicrobia bacterium]|nr:hypothetical protein [Elusimicrobiota bacterium]